MKPHSLLSMMLVLSACQAAGCGQDVNLAAVPQAVLGCEAPRPEDLVPEPPMLPGRHCQTCHTAGAQAQRRVWTASGTVFSSLTPQSSLLVPCNTAGLDGVTVQIADEHNRIIMTLTTNRAGNFFTAEQLTFKMMRAQVSKNGKSRQMIGFQPTSDCPECHRPGGIAGGRIYLD